jgi:hypothetical protein
VEFRDLRPGNIAPRFDGLTVPLDWIHRRDGRTDIYFLANLTGHPASARVAFRTAGRPPELWDAVTGQIRPLPEFAVEDRRTLVPLQFEPNQSWFVVFRPSASPSARPPTARNFPETRPLAELSGPWEVSFAPAWGGPAKATFETLQDWTKRPEKGIRYYSGTATYRKTFDLPPGALGRRPSAIFLDLGSVKNLARVRLNGKDLGVVWTAPWRLDITEAARAAANELAIEVVNLWPNRLIGDANLPPDQRRTKTNVRKFDQPGLPLLESGLLGPVTLKVSSP